MASLDQVTFDYSMRAKEYAKALGDMRATQEPDRDLITEWCGSFSGKILDLGCGPGHWTHYIAAQGKTVLGVDPTPLFIELASAKYPHDNFEVGTIADTCSGDYQGILAWYSLIHCSPDDLKKELKLIHWALPKKGSLLIGYFRGEALEPFDHAVTQAWYWPDSFITNLLTETEFSTLKQEHRVDPGTRAHGAVIATKE